MATPKSGNLIKLFLREAGSTAQFKYVVCNEDLSLDGTSDEISRPTKCGTLKAPGTPSFEIPLSGVMDTVPGVDQISSNEMWDWFASQQELEWLIADAATGATIVDKSGVGSLTAFTETYSVDDFIAFTGTLSVNGTPANNI